MKALTLDDVLPLEEYVPRRREFFEAHGRYLDRYRRVRIGSCLTLLFENRQTLWLRLQELLRIARLSEPARVQQELDLLCTHGILHLLGYDHAEPDEHATMFGLQDRLLAEWGPLRDADGDPGAEAGRSGQAETRGDGAEG